MTRLKKAPISKNGQVSIPAAVRHRWGVKEVLIVDEGDSLVLRPLPDDLIASVAGSLPSPPGGPTSEEIRAQMRADDARIEARKYGSPRN